MAEKTRKCMFFNCDVIKNVYPYHIVHDLYLYLCSRHASMASKARHSTVALIEFLVSVKGDSREYRQKLRNFIIRETSRKIDGR